MTNEDVYKYINSNDIQKYLRDINYNFNAAEAAWLIDQCGRLNIKEKHASLKDLMQSYPDPGTRAVPSKVFRHTYADKSLYPLIDEYIEAENGLLNAFYKKEERALYMTGAIYERMNDFRRAAASSPHAKSYIYYRTDADSADAYSSFEKLLAEETSVYEDDELMLIEVCKKYVDLQFEIVVRAAPDGTPIRVYSQGDPERIGLNTDILTLFDEMWFNFPVPFQRGDIVCFSEREDGLLLLHRDLLPFVLRGTTYNDSLSWEPGKSRCDSTDMNVYGYFIDDEGQIYAEVESGVMDLEYYKGEFNGTERTLLLLSETMKCENNEPDYELLINGYLKYRLDDYAKSSVPSGYLDETLKKFKIKESE